MSKRVTAIFACWSRAPHRKRHGQFSPTRKSLFRGQRILGDFARESGRSAGPAGPRRRRARPGLRSVGSCGPRPLCSDTSAAFDLQAPIAEQPANVVRSADWRFVSGVEDKPWYNDRSMWPPYLTLLTTARFNRFTLSFGLGYDYPQPVKDAYFYFAYPFLISVPGYTVGAVGLPDAEREHNLEMLQYISGEAASRGLDFQLGLWTHAYRWPKGSDANYTIEDLTPQTHAPYCRNALYAVLQACPGINGVALHVHGESGIPEMDFAFWQTLLEGVVRTGRRIEINLHAKGMSDRMIDIALATGLPVTISRKYWAEHCGLPYQPASIRKREMPPLHPEKKGFFDLSSGARRFSATAMAICSGTTAATGSFSASGPEPSGACCGATR